ncbi:unnamed protein product [Enterobius vermicularis]|uniref:Pentapeptide repeat-containing protein n=1 Tax=Enterobius vermicularis TaxID=51028 RepID=A0A0N4UYS2_ENTVE|nr:unnamed protein product [Enterobius vermicularis]
MVKFELLRLAKFVKHLLSRFFSAGKQGALYSYRRRRNLWDCYAVDARFLWILKVGTQQIDETVLNANAGLKVEGSTAFASRMTGHELTDKNMAGSAQKGEVISGNRSGLTMRTVTKLEDPHSKMN